MVKDAAAGVSCIRALGIVRDASCAGELIAVVADAKAPPRARAEAARALGPLKRKQAADALRGALREKTDKEVDKAAVWALALMGCREAEKEIAGLLDSQDEDTRFRAAIALTMLGSPKTKNLIPWLLEDRHSMELAAWAMWKTWDPKDAQAALEDAGTKHHDEICRKRLAILAKVVTGAKVGRY
jgi:HEAT repeat protein